MSSGGIDFSELLRSPLEPEREPGEHHVWWPVLAALVLGVVAGWLLVTSFAADLDRNPAPAGTSTTTGAEFVVEAAPFPDDYVQITPDVAARPEEPVRVGDRVLVPFTTVVRRGADLAGAARPLGGRWELTTEAGVVASEGAAYDPVRPSTFSVVFPGPVAFPEAIEMVERWDPRPVTVSAELPFTGLPYESEEPIVLDLGDGAQLIVTRLDLGNFQGRAQWELNGAPVGIVSLEVRLSTPDGAVLGDYEAGATPSLDPQRGAGFIDYIWGPGFGVDQNDATIFTLTADVRLGTPVPTEVWVPLTD